MLTHVVLKDNEKTTILLKKMILKTQYLIKNFIQECSCTVYYSIMRVPKNSRADKTKTPLFSAEFFKHTIRRNLKYSISFTDDEIEKLFSAFA